MSKTYQLIYDDMYESDNENNSKISKSKKRKSTNSDLSSSETEKRSKKSKVKKRKVIDQEIQAKFDMTEISKKGISNKPNKGDALFYILVPGVCWPTNSVSVEF